MLLRFSYFLHVFGVVYFFRITDLFLTSLDNKSFSTWMHLFVFMKIPLIAVDVYIRYQVLTPLLQTLLTYIRFLHTVEYRALCTISKPACTYISVHYELSCDVFLLDWVCGFRLPSSVLHAIS